MSIIGFVILHYKTIKDTTKCVDSILSEYGKKNKKYKIEVIVVDNGSGDGTGKKLQEHFKDVKNVYVILNEQNLGFARGNNVGFKKAKELGADYIVMTNNDVVFTQAEFCELIIEKYNKYNYAVLGPRILMPDGIDAAHNPVVKNLKQQKVYLKILYLRYILALLHLEIVFKKIIDKKYAKRHKTIDYDNLQFDIPVYGCCMVFSRNYIEKYDGLDDRTFLFCEEDLLYLRLKKDNMIEVYDPELRVLHNHSASINSQNKSLRKKELFKARNLIKSNKVLLKELKEISKAEKK